MTKEQNWIELNINQLNKLLELEYLRSENLRDMDEVLLNTVEDNHLWTNEFIINRIPYELVPLRGHFNFHAEDGISLDELLAIK